MSVVNQNQFEFDWGYVVSFDNRKSMNHYTWSSLRLAPCFQCQMLTLREKNVLAKRTHFKPTPEKRTPGSTIQSPRYSRTLQSPLSPITC